MKRLCLILTLILLGGCLAGSASAKTVAQWLQGFDTGEKWFGDGFAYDITDEEACWQLLQKPITILDAGQREEIYPRKTPDGKRVKNDKLGGFINGASAAVHVLGQDEDGWTMVEGIDYYNRIIRGYVRTRLLKEAVPNREYGIIIDKLTQRMYVFRNGKLWSSCLVSTGLPNDEQPYNETAAGEYLVVSRVGDFNSEGMICAMALRFNGGDMIHQVPYVLGDDGITPKFERYEGRLGTKASHGCVRTQREPTKEGLCAKWLWDNIPIGTKVVVWDDKSRAEPYPDAAEPVYYNPEGGQYYHSDPCCESVKKKYLPLTGFTLGELDNGLYSALSPCPVCKPPRSILTVAKANLKRGAITQEEYTALLPPMEMPADDFQIYYNPTGGKYYHATANCSSVKDRWLPLTALSYGELDTGSFAKLTPCPYCDPVKRKAEIEAYNAEIAAAEEQAARKQGPGTALPEDEPEEAENSAEEAIEWDGIPAEFTGGYPEGSESPKEGTPSGGDEETYIPEIRIIKLN